MTSYTLHIAHWSRQLHVAPYPKDLPNFEPLGINLIYDDETPQSILFEFARDAEHRLTHLNLTSNLGAVHRRGYAILQKFPGLPKFGWHDVELSFTDDGMMLWKLPPVYELPWCINYRGSNGLAEATRDLTLRVQSARRHGIDLQKMLRGAPDSLRSILPANKWMACVTGEVTA